MTTLSIDQAAKQRLSEIKKHKGEDCFIRLEITSGGCSGMQAIFKLDTIKNQDDIVIEDTSNSLVVDKISLELIEGSSVSYKSSLMGERFFLSDIPNLEARCGCGSSFAIK